MKEIMSTGSILLGTLAILAGIQAWRLAGRREFERAGEWFGACLCVVAAAVIVAWMGR